MHTLQFDSLIAYLKSKGVSFAIQDKSKLIGVEITHDGRNYRANGKIISKNMASLF